MIPEIVSRLSASLNTRAAIEALAKAIKIYNAGKQEQVGLDWHMDGDYESCNDLILDVTPKPGREETPEGATRSTREVIATQLTILEKERDRLIPIATREHWVA